MSVSDYLAPESLEECRAQLARLEGRGRLIAGGTDLMFVLQAGREDCRVLIDTTSIKGFDRLEIEDDWLIIGAGVSHARINRDERIAGFFPALGRACGSIGSPQIRNVATLAGNVVTAQPAADGAVALVALGARAEVAAKGGIREEPVQDLYQGLGRSRIDPHQEVLTRFRLKLPGPGQGNAFDRISPRNALCLPLVNAAAWVSSDQGLITEARIALGPVAERPFRPVEAEAGLVGAALDDGQAFEEAALAAAKAADPRDSCLRGCSSYRKQLVRVLTRRVLAQAARQAAFNHNRPQEDRP